MFFCNVGHLKMQQNLWPDWLAPNSVIVRRESKHWYIIICHHVGNWNDIMLCVLVFNERNYMISWSTIHSGVELRDPLLFSYISQTRVIGSLIISVYKAHTSMVIYMDRSEPHKQAYWYHSFTYHIRGTDEYRLSNTRYVQCHIQNHTAARSHF